MVKYYKSKCNKINAGYPNEYLLILLHFTSVRDCLIFKNKIIY